MNTDFITKSPVGKILGATGRVTALGVLVWVSANFASKSELNKMRKFQRETWMELMDLHSAFNDFAATNKGVAKFYQEFNFAHSGQSTNKN